MRVKKKLSILQKPQAMITFWWKKVKERIGTSPMKGSKTVITETTSKQEEGMPPTPPFLGRFKTKFFFRF